MNTKLKQSKDLIMVNLRKLEHKEKGIFYFLELELYICESVKPQFS